MCNHKNSEIIQLLQRYTDQIFLKNDMNSNKLNFV